MFFDKIRKGWSLTLSSWNQLRQDKQLVLFPILSGIACFLILAAFLAPVLLNVDLLKALANDEKKGGDGLPFWVYVVTFVYYFCTYFVVIFFNSALIGCAVLRFNGQPASLGDGLSIAASRLPQILAWALVSATVGLLLKMLENAHERVGQIVSALLGTAWSVLTFFVVPVLVVEKVGPFDAIQRSVKLSKATWGEALAGHMGISFFMFLAALPGILVLVLGIMALHSILPIGILLIEVAVIWLLILSAVGPALNGIFLAAMYQYATTKETPAGFDSDVMASAFRSKPAA